MRRYRAVILVLLFGILPVAVVSIVGVTVILPALNQREITAEQNETVEELPPEPVILRVALTAARPLAAGTLLTTGDLEVREVDEAEVPVPADQYVYVDEVEELAEAQPRKPSLRGFAVRRALAAGEVISRASVVGPDDAQFLATVLEVDRVAVSIPVSMANREARLVSPGNRVDVLLAVEQDGERVVGTIVEDVRVIAVNSRVIAEDDVRLLVPDRQETTEDIPPEAASSRVRPEVTTVTLEVQPVQGEQLALGAYEGQLSLAIRPLANGPQRLTGPVQNLRSVLRLPEEEPEPPPEIIEVIEVVEEVIEVIEVVAPPPGPVKVRVVRGTTEETVVFVDEIDGAEPTGASAADEPDGPRIITGTGEHVPPGESP